ncbi:MAG: urease accessory protein UreF [Ferruginibacter sp.]
MSASLFHLLHLSDPTLPVGGFTHSAGLETYVQQGLVHDFATAKEFVTQMLSRNIAYTDASLASLAYEAAMQNDTAALLQLNATCQAIKLPREMREASTRMGNRLLKIFESEAENESLRLFRQQLEAGRQAPHYCIAFAVCAVALGVGKKEMLTGFLYNAAVGFVTNCVKLIPLGQQQGQLLLHAIQPLLAALAENAMQPDEDLIGVCCPGFDIAQMQHEHLYTRLYIS